jgi:hypothetical protein
MSGDTRKPSPLIVTPTERLKMNMFETRRNIYLTAARSFFNLALTHEQYSASAASDSYRGCGMLRRAHEEWPLTNRQELAMSRMVSASYAWTLAGREKSDRVRESLTA